MGVSRAETREPLAATVIGGTGGVDRYVSSVLGYGVVRETYPLGGARGLRGFRWNGYVF